MHQSKVVPEKHVKKKFHSHSLEKHADVKTMQNPQQHKLRGNGFQGFMALKEMEGKL
jgi:hypothetical protein